MAIEKSSIHDMDSQQISHGRGVTRTIFSFYLYGQGTAISLFQLNGLRMISHQLQNASVEEVGMDQSERHNLCDQYRHASLEP